MVRALAFAIVLLISAVGRADTVVLRPQHISVATWGAGLLVLGGQEVTYERRAELRYLLTWRRINAAVASLGHPIILHLRDGRSLFGASRAVTLEYAKVSTYGGWYVELEPSSAELVFESLGLLPESIPFSQIRGLSWPNLDCGARLARL